MTADEFLAKLVAERLAALAVPPRLPCPASLSGSQEAMVACGCQACLDAALSVELETYPIGKSRSRFGGTG